MAQGDNTENAWIMFFRRFLPSRYSCNRAFVVDSKGDFSEQIDIVIYDRYFSPVFFEHGVIPAESVYAIFEVKLKLNKKNFEYTQKKIGSVKLLSRTSASVICNGELKPGRKPFEIIGGLLTIENGWKRKSQFFWSFYKKLARPLDIC